MSLKDQLPDRLPLLADLLNEAVFLMETEGFLPTALEARELDGGRLRGALAGRRVDALRPLVKAATYHRLAVWREEVRFIAERQKLPTLPGRRSWTREELYDRWHDQ